MYVLYVKYYLFYFFIYIYGFSVVFYNDIYCIFLVKYINIYV